MEKTLLTERSVRLDDAESELKNVITCPSSSVKVVTPASPDAENCSAQNSTTSDGRCGSEIHKLVNADGSDRDMLLCTGSVRETCCGVVEPDVVPAQLPAADVTEADCITIEPKVSRVQQLNCITMDSDLELAEH
jgi:hypothetical protein